MSDCKSEQRVNIRFLVKLKKSAKEFFNYGLRLTVKIVCLVHACLNGINYFRKAEKA